MSDFYQNGIIPTLHNLDNRAVDQIESELLSFSKQRKMAVILPSLFSELEGEALPNILEELAHASYLDRVIVGLDRADKEQYRYALQFFSKLPQQVDVLWNDGPRLTEIYRDLESQGLAAKEPGKGKNVWNCIGYTLSATNAESIALHDCDILTYDRSLLARLIYPVANPAFPFDFCKGYYSRIADNKFNGRACRLLVSPLLKTLKTVLGDQEYLNYMHSFRYSLAGEFSFRRSVLQDLRIPSDWGLEIGVLSEMYRNHSRRKICQVDIADIYDHKHQDLSPDDAEAGLSKMSIDISKAIFRKLATQGHIFSTGSFRTIKATYYRTALDYIDTYSYDARINGLHFDNHQEEQAVELFAENIMRAGEIFLERPSDTPFIPSWSRVQSAFPDILERLKLAVELDQQDYK